MCNWRDCAALILGSAAVLLPAAAETRFGFGRAPTHAEVSAWDIDVRPDGHGVKVGRGTVARGQEIFDAKCASCHGTFGENNQYMVIAGGVRAEDLKSGRAAGLRTPGVVRTLGNKLNYATTLWDYINRAMPWNAPQSLTVDEVYAVTAYVLYLNEIVPLDFQLTNENLLTVEMPNRNGMTRAHGLGDPAGTPDVQGGRCMSDCGAVPSVTSQLPDHALNSHGELRAQFRPFGPLGAVDSGALGPRDVATRARTPREILTRNACTACHGFDRAAVGPAFKEVAARYRDRGDAAGYLVEKIRKGGAGVWGAVAMPGQSGIREEDLAVVVRAFIEGNWNDP